MASTRHPSFGTPFAQRAEAAVHPLTAYLFRLMVAKSSNLCLSADVSTARELLNLADRVGPSIVVLKTHYDLVSGWDYNPQTGTGAQLAALARKHGFLLFEDRKFADIGKTVQQQYTAGTARIIDWAHMVTVNMDAGAAAVTALADAAAHWRERIHCEVRASVTVGTPVHENFEEDFLPSSTTAAGSAADSQRVQPSLRIQPRSADGNSSGENIPLSPPPRDADGRKGSIVSVTTVTQHYEPMDSPRLPRDGALAGDAAAEAAGTDARTLRAAGAARTAGTGAASAAGTESGKGSSSNSAAAARTTAAGPEIFPGLEEAPLERGILLLAQMSSKGNLMTPAYTQACVEAARAHKSFVVGFIAQESLNTLPDDAFVHLTPGCKLPPPGEDMSETRAVDGSQPLAGDGMGQQYNTPALLVGERGTDIIIVGRGIITAADAASEAERYRRRAWKAYLARLRPAQGGQA